MNLVTSVFFISSLFFIQLTDGSDPKKLQLYDKCKVDGDCDEDLNCINNFCQKLIKPDGGSEECKNGTCSWENSECSKSGRCYCKKSHPKLEKNESSKKCYSDGRISSSCQKQGIPCPWAYSTCAGFECVCPPEKPIIDNKLQRCLSVPHNYSTGTNCTGLSWLVSTVRDCNWTDSYCKYPDRICYCNDGYSVKDYNRERCLRPRGNGTVGSYCESNKECPVVNAECVNNTCVCKKSTANIGGQCKDPKAFNPSELNITCISTSDCIEIKDSDCVNGQCKCTWFTKLKGFECQFETLPTLFNTSGLLNAPCRYNFECEPSNSQ